MTKLQQLLDAKRAERNQLSYEIDALILCLRPVCDHSKTEIYVWEHDNGYGRQSDIKGQRCSYCGCIDLWSRNKFVDPAEIDS